MTFVTGKHSLRMSLLLVPGRRQWQPGAAALEAGTGLLGMMLWAGAQAPSVRARLVPPVICGQPHTGESWALPRQGPSLSQGMCSGQVAKPGAGKARGMERSAWARSLCHDPSLQYSLIFRKTFTRVPFRCTQM